MSIRKYTPVLVIGAGLAGCTTALMLADKGMAVTVLAATEDEENANSWQAQGGIIYRSLDKDDAEKLSRDIMVAGHYHNNAQAVDHLCSKGPEAVHEILVERLKIPFDRHLSPTATANSEDWDLTREGGHSTQRILHCADHTGYSIMDYMLQAVKENANITLLQGYSAIDLLTSHHHSSGMTFRYQLQNQCCGAYVLNEKTGAVETLLADYTVLATGGVGQVYLHSTNALAAVGSGIAMASRAFVRMENMEFVQFHPTTFFQYDKPRFLITEALRGEGGLLINARGERFMTRYDSRAELAPRDIVARAIVDEMLETRELCVYLDARGVEHDLKERFPTIYHSCLERGVDIEDQPIPVVPAAHYFCGGVLSDTHGRTSLERLYCLGETACTGLHGANRLASTSLLEALLWGDSAAKSIAGQMHTNNVSLSRLFDSIKDWQHLGSEQNDDPALIAQDWSTIRNTMWNYVGITRTEPRLARAFDELRELSRQLHNFYKSTAMSKPIVDLFHGCQTAYLITQAALRNTTSMGCHYRV